MRQNQPAAECDRLAQKINGSDEQRGRQAFGRHTLAATKMYAVALSANWPKMAEEIKKYESNIADAVTCSNDLSQPTTAE